MEVGILVVLISSIIVEIIVGKVYLKMLERKGIVQPLLKGGPEHTQKVGTPTMGGISFIITISIMFIFSMLVMLGSNKSIMGLIATLVVFLGYALIGYKDDILKVMNKRNESGLSPKQKLVMQFALAIFVFMLLLITNHDMGLNFFIFNIELPVLGIQAIIYFIFILLLMVGMSNATNLTDGLDGLLTSTYIVSLVGLAIIAMMQNNAIIFMCIIIVIGALLGFLKYNFNPAKMFMGDTGSLALGALLVLFAIALKVEVLLLLIGIVFILETLSVMIQVLYFKYTKKKTGEGKRVFLMAPYHHHLEKKGLSEKKVVALLSFIQLIGVIAAIILYV